MTPPEGLLAISSIQIDASRARVWQALTDPAMIRQYLFGTEVITNWRQGSPITYRGTWNGNAYEDKGLIEKIIPEELLQTTYWSSLSGTEDKPENYARVTQTLSTNAGKTTLKITQDHCPTAASKAHSEENWGQVLNALKKLLEKK